MEKEPRKATDIILNLESKVDILLSIVRSQDLNIKILSNKLNSIIEKLEQEAPKSKFIVEAVQNTTTETLFGFNNIPVEEEKSIEVDPDFTVKLDNSPQGFRRVSRPETFSADINKKDESSIFPMQLPNMPQGRSEQDAQIIVNTNLKQEKKVNKKEPSSGSVPVMQRIVDKNGKSVFLADVEIIDVSSGEQASKTRTNGTGKWMATLSPGDYKVIIRKRESLTKEKIEVIQDVRVDGTQSPFDLQTMIIK